MKNHSNETIRLIYWAGVWAGRFFRTIFHIFYRPAYRKFKNKQAEKKSRRFEPEPLDFTDHNLYY